MIIICKRSAPTNSKYIFLFDLILQQAVLVPDSVQILFSFTIASSLYIATKDHRWDNTFQY